MKVKTIAYTGMETTKNKTCIIYISVPKNTKHILLIKIDK